MWPALRSWLLSLAHANLLMALCGASATAAAQAICALPLHGLPMCINALVFFAIYNLDRLAGRESDEVNHAERSAFLKRHSAWLAVAATIAYLTALGLSLLGGAVAVMSTLLPLVAVLLYAFPWVPTALARRVGFRRLKELLWVKNLVVAGTWASAALGLSAAFGAAPPAGAALMAWLFVCGRMWINGIVFDLRDREGDAQSGVRTLPVVLGPARTLRVLQRLNVVLAVACLSVGFFVGPRVVAALSLSSLYAGLYLRAAKHARAEEMHFLCDVIVDGEWLFLGALAVMGR